MSVPTAWVEVNADAVLHNFREIKRLVGPSASVMAVLKSNAYGHGLELMAEFLAGEAEWFGLSTVDEGIRARAVAPENRILVFHPCGPWNAEEIVEHNLTATVDSLSGAQALAEVGRKLGKKPVAHLKIDTGMGRFGIRATNTDEMLRVIDTPDIEWKGIYTHLAVAAGPGNGARLQLNAFDIALKRLHAEGFQPPYVHALNSAGLLRFPEHRYQMVRSGTLLFGQYPSAGVPRLLSLKPTWALKTRVISLREIPAGASVGYGAEWTAKRNSRIATIALGYADGPTMLPQRACAQAGGLKGLIKRITGRDRLIVTTPHGPAPVVGRVAAQSMMLDVTDVPSVRVGDIVEVPSRRVPVGAHIPRIPITHTP